MLRFVIGSAFACWVAAYAAVEDRPTTIEEFMRLDSSIRVIAHRGFSSRAPENTLAAVRQAIAVGADMVEVDVTVTADGHVICLHDDTLDRTTDGSGRAAETTLAEIRRLDAGSWFSPEYAGERVPTLAEVLDTVRNRILINVEIKPEAVGHGVVPRVAELIVAHGMTGDVMVSSFSPEALRRMKTTEPAIVTACLFNDELHAGRDPLEILQETGARGFNLSARQVTPDIVERCHRHGVPVAVYTVNRRRQMRRLVAMGVDAIFTDHPERLVAVRSEERRAGAVAGSAS